MNQANTLCLISWMIVLTVLGIELCFDQDSTLGGWGPVMLMVAGPLIGYMLGRLFFKRDMEQEDRDRWFFLLEDCVARKDASGIEDLVVNGSEFFD